MGEKVPEVAPILKNLKTYEIDIVETLTLKVKIEAESYEAAQGLVQKFYHRGVTQLDTDSADIEVKFR